MNKLLQNPLFRFVGTITVIYFVAFHNSRDPDSIGSLLKSDDFKEQIKEVKTNSGFILRQVAKARQMEENKKNLALIKQNNSAEISQKDLFLGMGSQQLKCGDEALISYEIYDNQERLINRIPSRKIFLTKQNKNFLNQAILGMKKNAVRVIYVPQKYPNQDSELKSLLKRIETDLKFRITVIALKNTFNCK